MDTVTTTKCYIVNYEINSLERSGRVIEAIRNYGTWGRITENTWAIITTDSAVSIRNNLRQFLINTDRLFVIKSGFEAAWTNSRCTNDWLRGNL